jgi:hypothetical protein
MQRLAFYAAINVDASTTMLGGNSQWRVLVGLY